MAASSLDKNRPDSSTKDTVFKKSCLRNELWDYMEQYDLVKDIKGRSIEHGSSHGKIPYFRGCERAAERFARLKEFRDAKIIKINPSLAQMHLRFLTMRKGKILIVPSPALETVLFHRVDPTTFTANWHMRRASSKAGAAELGEEITLDTKLKIDIVVVASVVCARNGARLGKGMGYAEMEWAILTHMGAVDESTLVATTVHDCQILDDSELPSSIMEEHDLPVDIIVTPTRIINTKTKFPKPMSGILWDKISEETLAAIPVLQILQKRCSASSIDK